MCHAWAAAGITVLWRSVTAASLRSVADAARRQMYADLIHELHVWGRVRPLSPNGADGDDMLEGLRFGRLRHLRFEAVANSWREDLAPTCRGIVPFLQPRLVSLDCPARELDALAVRQLLVAQCTQLRQLALRDVGCSGACDYDERQESGADEVVLPLEGDGLATSGCDSKLIMVLLQRLPSVEMLTVSTLWYHACGSDLLIYLAAHPRLAALADLYVTTARLHRLLRCVPQPFRMLRHLKAEITANGLPLLVAATPSVVEMTLEITADNDMDIGDTYAPAVYLLRPLAALRHLQRLRLTFAAHTTLCAADVAASLEQLPPRQLRELRICSQVPITCDEDREYPLHISEGYTNGDFARLLARQPRLVCLHFMARSPSMSPAAYRIVGEACRQLRELGLSQKCRLSAMEGARVQPLFPQLQSVESREPLPLRIYWNPDDWRYLYSCFDYSLDFHLFLPWKSYKASQSSLVSERSFAMVLLDA